MQHAEPIFKYLPLPQLYRWALSEKWPTVIYFTIKLERHEQSLLHCNLIA